MRTPRQAVWDEILRPFLDNLDYRRDRVSAWWPQGRQDGIRIDPEWGYGQPVIARRGVRVDILSERWEAGDSIVDIAAHYEVAPEDVRPRKVAPAPDEAAVIGAAVNRVPWRT
ncbi:MAG: DUF433 domain-containing protein [Thermaerobacter sp.]|nr:DUF433 domain-containing protein [Thermaerobacter sp.]